MGEGNDPEWKASHTHFVSQSVTNTWPGAKCVPYQARLKEKCAPERKSTYSMNVQSKTGTHCSFP